MGTSRKREGGELSEQERIAADARKRARLARGLGPAHRGDLTPAQVALRNAAIIASVHTGMDKRQLAREFLLTPRSIDRILEEHRRMRTPLEAAPMEILERLLRSYESQIERFARVALDTIERAPAVAIAALKGEQEAVERCVALLTHLGKLPGNLERFRSEAQMLRVGEAMLERIKLLEEGQISAAEVGDFFRELVTMHAPAWELAPGDVTEESDDG